MRLWSDDIGQLLNQVINHAINGDSELTQSKDPAALIREVRARLGLTQEKFAARLGVTLPTINRWENGRAKPSPLAIQKLRDLISSMGDEAESLLRRTH